MKQQAKRGRYENLFKRPGMASKRAADRLASIGVSTRAEVLAMLAGDSDLLGMVFDQAVKAGIIERSGHAGLWVGCETMARRNAAEDWQT